MTSLIHASVRTVFLAGGMVCIALQAIGQPASDAAKNPDKLADRILARPLFIASRRADADAPTAVQADAMPSSLRLVGIVFFSGQRRALVQLDSGKPVLVAAGGSVAGYTINKISQRDIEAEGFGERRTIKMSRQDMGVTDKPFSPQQRINAAP